MSEGGRAAAGASGVAGDPASAGESIHPLELMHELDRELAPNATICADVGTCISWTFRGIPVRRPGRFFATVDFSPMGCGIAGAIGVALARPEEHVICIAGDGAFLMHGTEISTAVAHGIRVTWAVLNDGQMSASAGPVSGRMDPSPVARIGANDLAAMARALGAEGIRVDTRCELRAGVQKRWPPPVPASSISRSIQRSTNPTLDWVDRTPAARPRIHQGSGKGAG